MKNGAHTPERDPYPGAATLAQFRAQSLKHLLNVAPSNISPDRILKNRSQRFSMLFAHRIIVSIRDTIINRITIRLFLGIWFSGLPDFLAGA